MIDPPPNAEKVKPGTVYVVGSGEIDLPVDPADYHPLIAKGLIKTEDGYRDAFSDETPDAIQIVNPPKTGE